jgi:DNA-binding transcriptional regulator YiaG
MHNRDMANRKPRGKITAAGLRALRKRRRESQTVFGEHFRADQSTIHRWETDGPPRSGPLSLLVELVVPGLRERGPAELAR